MKKILLVSVLALACFAVSFAETVAFTDITPNHWAKDHVYKMVNLGIVKGLPDGTFKGESMLNRYETVSFFAKFADIYDKKIEEVKKAIPQNSDTNAVSARLLNELRAELNALESEVAVLKSAPPEQPKDWIIEGKMTAHARVYDLGNANINRKELMQKVDLSLTKVMGDGSKINFQYNTDYMLFDGAQNLPNLQAFSAVANFKAEALDFPLNVEISSGPGNGQDYLGDPVILPEDKLLLATRWGAFDIWGAYIQRTAATSLIRGEIKTILPLGFMGPTDISLGLMDYYQGVSPLNRTKDMQYYLELGSMPSDKVMIGTSLILGNMFEVNKMALGASLSIDDYWGAGSNLTATFYKYGDNFFDPVFLGLLDEYGALKINAFGKWVGINANSNTGLIGTDLAIATTKKISSKWSVKGKFWMPFTGTFGDAIFTRVYAGLAYEVSNNCEFSFGYDYTSFGAGAIPGKPNTTADLIDFKASLGF
ncbi:MAG: S-layer homology domain-containing protein [Candidatus Margulisiibacteriota bacterium]|jgi:opacity protein-like surface antigen